MIPQFPNFKKLQIEDKEEIEKIIDFFPPYSDFNFTSLYGYNTENLIEISILNNNLVVLFTDYLTNKPFYSFIGNSKSLETSITLLKKVKEKNIIQSLKLIPEVAITEELFSSPDLKITEDQDNFDYILSVNDLANLTNRHYNKKKQFMIFENLYPNKKIVELNLEDKNIQQQIFQVFDLWKKQKNKTIEDTSTELTAIKKTIENANYLNAFGIGIFVKNKLIGFSIADLSQKDYAEFHFAKGDYTYTGIFAALYIYLAQFLANKNYSYINIEQDLGIVGLRNAKEQWHPINFLKKYQISHKQG